MSDYCYCDPDDRPDTLTETVHKARIRHVCSECRGWIEPGEVYEKSWGVWDGEPNVFKTCPDCLALKDWTLAHIPCFCWTYGGLRGEAREAIGFLLEDEQVPGMWMEFGRLYVKGGRRGKVRRDEIKARALAEISLSPSAPR